MSNKGKVMHEAMKRLFERTGRLGVIDYDLIRDLLAEAYDAGTLAAPDIDAARWRMFCKEFGTYAARQIGRFYLPPLPVRAISFDAADELVVRTGARWRLVCEWAERTGEADTIPKFIDVMLREHRNDSSE